MSRHQRKAAAAKKDGPRASRKPQKARRRSRRPQEATAPEAAAQPNPSTVVAVNPEDLKGTRKIIGGSWSDNWNNIIVNQAVNTLWLKHLSLEERDKQFSATIAALAGIGPKDELEGMLGRRQGKCKWDRDQPLGGSSLSALSSRHHADR